MLIATDFIILRNIKANGLASHPLERRPVKVATLIDEAAFNKAGHGLLHNKTVFLEDEVHDWNWRDGQFRYYTRIATEADVVIAFAVDDVVFCTQCGAKRLKAVASCEQCAETGNGE